MLRIVLRNIASNWLGFAISIAITFFLTPYVLHTLGDTRYGVWILVVGLNGYFGLLDLGLRGGVTQYLTRYLAQNDYIALNRTASTSVAALGTCGIIVFSISVILGWLSPSIFSTSASTTAEIRWCIIIFGISTGIQFGFAPFSSVFVARQRYDLINIIEVSVRMLVAIGTYGTLRAGYGLVGICVAEAIGNLVACMIRAQIAHRILPVLHISLRMVAWKEFGPILSYSAVNCFNRGGEILKAYSSSLIIGFFMPLAALAPYNLAARLADQIDSLFRPVGAVFYPIVTNLDVDGDLTRLQKIYFMVSRIMLCLAVPVAMIGAFWAADFYRLWVGPELVNGKDYTSVVLLFWVLVAGSVVNIGQKIGIHILFGCRAIRILALLTLAEAIGIVILLILLIPTFGLLGAAVANLTSVMIIRGFIFPFAVCYKIKATAREYFLNTYIRPTVLAVLLVFPLSMLHDNFPVSTTWSGLALCGFLSTFLSAPIVLMIALDRHERRLLVFGPLQHLLIRCRLAGPKKDGSHPTKTPRSFNDVS
jgi:O-antigen/teichoic acid export membrane protein